MGFYYERLGDLNIIYNELIKDIFDRGLPSQEDLDVGIKKEFKLHATVKTALDLILRDEIFAYRPSEGDDYDNAEYEIETDKEEIKKLTLEIQEKEFKKDNVEAELIVLEKDIERLDYYSDDETNYRDMEYSEEIDELQQQYNDYKRIFEELETYLGESYKELDKLQTNLKENKTILEKYSGESLIDLYVEEVTAERTHEALNDIEDWLDDRGLEISEALDYGLIHIDKGEVIEGAVESDGLGHWLAGYDGYENEETITLEDGNYSDPFYLFRIE